MQITKTNNEYKNSFTSMSITNRELRYKVWNSATEKQKKQLNEIWNNERENPVHAIFYSSKFGLLKARVMCAKFLVNFKEHYTQIPVFESKFSFIKRMASVIQKYNEQLKNAQSI